MKRAYRYRFYPTPGQEAELRRTFGCVRAVWNWALAHRTEAFYERQERVGYPALSALLTTRKADPDLAWLNEVSSVPLQQCLRHQQVAFANFFARRARYPRFKSRKYPCQSAEYTRSGFRFKVGELRLAKMTEPLHVRWSRQIPDGCEPSTATVSLDAAGRWHVSLLVDEPDPPALPVVNKTVGLDLGVSALVTLSTGEKIVGGKHGKADRKRLARAQRNLSRKEPGSRNREKARMAVARIHARIADRRQDELHKLSTRLVRENQVIAVEDLNTAGMVKNRSLARAIADQGWRSLRVMLTYKAERCGRTLVVIDRWFPSSKRCNKCGHQAAKMPLNVREWECPECGAIHDRDVNAARNVLAAGLAVIACGDGVRPTRQKSAAAVRETGTSDREV